MSWAGGTSEFRLIAGDAIGMGTGSGSLTTPQFGLGGGQIFAHFSSEESSDFQGITGYFPGVGCPPYGGSLSYSGGGLKSIGILPGDIVIHTASTLAARPGRVTLHACLRSTANFSTGTYSSTGGWDITLSNSSTA